MEGKGIAVVGPWTPGIASPVLVREYLVGSRCPWGGKGYRDTPGDSAMDTPLDIH
jgi:hypothetical protein